MQTLTFDSNNASSVLNSKHLLQQIMGILQNSNMTLKKHQTHDAICGALSQNGWQIKHNLLVGTNYAQDAFNSEVLIEVDFSIIDSVHRNFLRAEELFRRGTIKAFVQIVPIDFEPKFEFMQRDIQLFGNVLHVPIYLIGVK